MSIFSKLFGGKNASDKSERPAEDDTPSKKAGVRIL